MSNVISKQAYENLQEINSRLIELQCRIKDMKWEANEFDIHTGIYGNIYKIKNEIDKLKWEHILKGD